MPDFQVLCPGGVSEARVRAWKCDYCEEIHVVLYIRCDPPEDTDLAPFYGAMELSEDAAAHILNELPGEMEYPVQGVDGGVMLPMVAF